MRDHRKYLLCIAFLFLLGKDFYSQQKTGSKNGPQPEELQWYTRLEKAYEVSKNKNKPVFAFFTGSDWCGWCKKLQAEVFAKPEFVKWARKNVVLLELDFPRFKQLDQEQLQHNYSLQQTFGVMGYPTVWLFHLSKPDTSQKMNLTPLGQLGYPVGAEPGKEEVKFLHTADSLLLIGKKKK